MEMQRSIKIYTLISYLDYLFITTPVPLSLSYLWNFGSMLGLLLIIQIITGVSLAFHYIPHTDYAFDSIQYIMIEENYGWFLRYVHSNGASVFFIFVYFHISRSLYFCSYYYPRNLLWNIGVIIYILMMAIAFLGYVLVWGSMSLWGAIVITNFFSTIPWLGAYLVYFIWGGFTVDNPTITRFYALHFTLPWVLLIVVFIHILVLHVAGSNNPNGQSSISSNESFHPLFTYKDLITFIISFNIIIFLVGYMPNVLSHPDNYIKANPLVTPSSIVPEWYFLPFYGILRSIPDKTLGVLAMALSIMVLFILPLVSFNFVRSATYKNIYIFVYWLFVFNFIALLIIGSLPVEYPYSILGSIFTLNYFNLLFTIPMFVSLWKQPSHTI